MYRHVYQTVTDVPAEKLYQTVCDINNWPRFDDGLEATSLIGPCVTGATFTLKPRGGPKVNLRIEEATAPTRLTDVAFLPLARMRTVHEYVQRPDGTHITMIVEVTGILAFLWNRIIARPQILDAEKQTAKMIAYARSI
jgi:hypothetical protein